MTLNGNSTGNGIYVSGNATVLTMKNTLGTTSDRISYVLSHNTDWEMSLGGSAHPNVPNGLYWYNSGTYMMTLTSGGRLGIGTTSPSSGLHVATTNTFTFGIGGSTVYRLRTDGGITDSALGPISYSVSAVFSGYISCQSMAMTSDRRLKKNIEVAPLDRIERETLRFGCCCL